MRIEQLKLFNEKGSFSSEDFESLLNKEVFKSIGEGVSNAFYEFSKFDITNLCNITRSNILNDFVVTQIGSINSDRLKYFKSLTNTRRSFAVLDEKYVLFFKKFPVSNIKTNQDDLIKNQALAMHVLFLVYYVDEFWSSISKLEFQFFSSPENVIYKLDISEYMTGTVVKLKEEEIIKPNIQLKKSITKQKKAQ